MTTAADTASVFETVFRRIERERMADMPLLNPALEVTAVDFIEWQGAHLGVLITPWFMNLVWQVCDVSEDDQPAAGSKHVHSLPAGDYEFIAAHEPGLGHYKMCSLFSPVFEFADQATAVATAQAVMVELMTEPELAQGGDQEKKALTRRDLLRGGFSPSGASPS